MNIKDLYIKAIRLQFLSTDEGLYLYNNSPTSELMFVANEIRKKLNPGNIVGWIIDRNVNISNICSCCCKFCNFYRRKNASDAYITTIEQYKEKINRLYELGGNQLLLQGGLHPELGLKFYMDLFQKLKKEYPSLKLHALSPPEIVHISRMEGKTYRAILLSLIEAGLDSLPGGGAEILSDRVRKIISPRKCTSGEWLEVMRQAHALGIRTSATMMFWHIETKKERLEHLELLRKLQSEKSKNSPGFVAFIPWPFQDKGTILEKKGIKNTITAEEYIRTLAISRIMLPNIKTIQASWLTAGIETAKLCLHSGANDMGSIMIEENVVSSAGVNWKMDKNIITQAITNAGFIPFQRGTVPL
ncbi:MAG: dehypoxanthine futalosine cyclase [Bacteroidia bacterium]|nr:dehypoxanthine futalosine cyclase [Bacteroidia bacterium]